MSVFFFFSSRRRHTRCSRDWSSDVCSSDLGAHRHAATLGPDHPNRQSATPEKRTVAQPQRNNKDRKSTRLNSSHGYISYAVFCLKKKTKVLDAMSRPINVHLDPDFWDMLLV